METGMAILLSDKKAPLRMGKWQGSGGGGFTAGHCAVGVAC